MPIIRLGIAWDATDSKKAETLTMFGTKGLLNRLFEKTSNKGERETGLRSPLLRWVSAKSLLGPDKLLRLGTPYGGWIIPGESGLSSDSVCYSAGAGEDISFDCAIAETFHCHVRIIDPTPRAIAHFDNLRRAVNAGERFPINGSEIESYTITLADLEKLSLIPVGLANRDTELKFFFPKNPMHVSCSILNLQKTENYFVAQCHRLTSIMNQAGDASVDLLKMDIEGGEYGVIEDLLSTNMLPRVLLVEFDEVHSPLDSEAGDRIKAHIDMLTEAGMKCVAVDGSNATFVRERLLSR
jgi:FkbM family methyltransferase